MSDLKKQAENKRRGRWKPGESGNAAGRPPGTGEVARLRQALGERLPEVLEVVIGRALEGDAAAARLVLERTVPPLKAQEQAQPFDLAGATFTEQGRAVLAAVAAGSIAPAVGAALLGAIGTLAKVAEVDELTRRIEALEGKA